MGSMIPGLSSASGLEMVCGSGHAHFTPWAAAELAPSLPACAQGVSLNDTLGLLNLGKTDHRMRALVGYAFSCGETDDMMIK